MNQVTSVVRDRTQAAKSLIDPHLHHVDLYGVDVKGQKRGSWCGLLGSLIALGFIAWSTLQFVNRFAKDRTSTSTIERAR